MLAKDLISTGIPFLRLTDNGQKALNWMEIFRLSHMPVVEENEYMGLISDKSIYDLNLSDSLMNEHREHMLRPFVYADSHIYEVVSVFEDLKITVLPVLDTESKYLGAITIFDVTRNFADLMAVKEQGGVIVLELNSIDYSLAQIAQIVEGNDVKILSLYISKQNDSKEMLVTLKLNTAELSTVLQTFMRYNYNIKRVFADNPVLKDMYGDRFDQLIKYMNI